MSWGKNFWAGLLKTGSEWQRVDGSRRGGFFHSPHFLLGISSIDTKEQGCRDGSSGIATMRRSFLSHRPRLSWQYLRRTRRNPQFPLWRCSEEACVGWTSVVSAGFLADLSQMLVRVHTTEKRRILQLCGPLGS